MLLVENQMIIHQRIELQMERIQLEMVEVVEVLVVPES
jgi:hypothetical protein